MLILLVIKCWLQTAVVNCQTSFLAANEQTADWGNLWTAELMMSFITIVLLRKALVNYPSSFTMTRWTKQQKCHSRMDFNFKVPNVAAREKYNRLIASYFDVTAIKRSDNYHLFNMRVFKALRGNKPSSKRPNSRSQNCRCIGHENGKLYVNLKAEVNGRAGIRNLLASKAKPVKTGATNLSCQNIKVWKDPETKTNKSTAVCHNNNSNTCVACLLHIWHLACCALAY